MTGELATDDSLPLDAVRSILERTNIESPSEEDVAELRQLLRDDPTLWELTGNMVRVAIREVIEAGTPTAFVSESVAHGVSVIRGGLGYDKASAMERLLIEQIALCWLRLNLMELSYTSAWRRSSLGIAQATFFERRLDHVQRRFLRACETLAKIRRMGPRALQVNIAAAGGQQLNVACGESGEGR